MKVRIIGAAIVAASLHMVAFAAGQSTDAIVTEGVVNAPLAEVWRMWTTREGMESWMVGRTDFTLTVGAIWHTSYDKQSSLDDDRTIHQQLLAYDPGRMLATRTVKPPKGFPFPNEIDKTWTVVYFEADGPTRTKVTAKMFGYTASDESQKMRAFFEKGNRATLDSLIKRFAKP